jgi:hypothetical protein
MVVVAVLVGDRGRVGGTDERGPGGGGRTIEG